MAFDFRKAIAAEENNDGENNPIKFFYDLSHPEIIDLFPVQYDILKNWNESYGKNENDKIISLDTGAGKTLIGLMIAESIRRTKKGKVLFLCPNNYLISQAKEKALEYGLKVSTYMSGRWEYYDEFLENKNICITNYDAAFNRISKFKDLDIVGVIFDDAHLSIELLDKQFTLVLNNQNLKEKIIDIFSNSDHIKEKLELIKQNDPNTLVMIPFYEWMVKHDEVKNLIESSIDTNLSSFKFPWMNIREDFNKTMCFISKDRVEISLMYPNINSSYILDKSIHRVYLSATIANHDDIIRVFGKKPTPILIDNFNYRPERLFVFPNLTSIPKAEEVVRDNLNQLIKKGLILVPNRASFSRYPNVQNLITVDNPEEAEQKINNFKESANEFLILASRYDGIDLPNNSCRLLVLDGFPYIGSLKNRFFTESFGKDQNDINKAYIASKIIQAFGRTLRGKDDYSVILVIGDQLTAWLKNKDNAKYFKSELNQDMKIGKDISKAIRSIDDLKDLISEMLSRSEAWKTHLEANRKTSEEVINFTDEEIALKIKTAEIERDILNSFYNSNYKETILLISKYEMDLSKYSNNLLALYLSISLICKFELNQLDESFYKIADRINSINSGFGTIQDQINDNSSMQAKNILAQKFFTPAKYDWSNYSSGQYEENLKDLGIKLGFESLRPEKEGSSTLDNLWVDNEKKIAIGIELKSDKENKTLFKKEVDQSLGHNEWIKSTYPDFETKIYILGDIEFIDKLANPGENLYWVNTKHVKELTERIIQIYNYRKLNNNIDSELDRLSLWIEKILGDNKLIDLKNERSEDLG